VYVKLVSFEGPPIQNTTITLTYTGPDVAGNFYCGGTQFEIHGYSTSEGYVKVSGADGLPAAGQYDVGFTYNGTNYGFGFNIDNATVSNYLTIEVPSLSSTTITCTPGASCSATMTNSTCTSSDGTTVSASGRSKEITDITIPSDFGSQGSPGFQPSSVTVVIGVNNTVRWTDDASFPVTVTSTSFPSCGQTFDSGMLHQGKTFTVTFTTPGTYQYESVFDQGLNGTITVEAS